MARNEKSKSCAIGASLAETRGMFAHTSEMIQTTFSANNTIRHRAGRGAVFSAKLAENGF
jgi:hypothetical protein